MPNPSVPNPASAAACHTQSDQKLTLPLFPGSLHRDSLLTSNALVTSNGELKLRFASMISDICFSHSNVLVLGAGFSRDATGSDWNSLTEKIGEAIKDGGGCLPENWASLSMPERAQTFLNWHKHDDKRCLLEDLVAQNTQVQSGFPREQEMTILKRFASLGGYIVTTNYDNLAEKTLEALGIPFRVVADEHEVGLPRPQPPPGGVLVLKLHGDLSSRNMIISQDDYNTIESERPQMAAFARELLGNKLPIFYGFGLSDPDIDALLPHSGNTPHAVGYAFGANLSTSQFQFADKHNLVIVEFDSIPQMTDGMRLLSRELIERAHFKVNLLTQINSLGDTEATKALNLVFTTVEQQARNLLNEWPEVQATGQNLGSAFELAHDDVAFFSYATPTIDRRYWEMGQRLILAVQNGAAISSKVLWDFGEVLLEQGRNDSAKQLLQLSIQQRKKEDPQATLNPAETKTLIGVFARFGEHREIILAFDALAKSSYWKDREQQADLVECLEAALHASYANIDAVTGRGFARRAELLYAQAIERFVLHIAPFREISVESRNAAAPYYLPNSDVQLSLLELLGRTEDQVKTSPIVDTNAAVHAIGVLRAIVSDTHPNLPQAQYIQRLNVALHNLLGVMRGVSSN